jgi:lambda family phage portal protein
MFDFNGMLSQIVRTRRAAGEIFIRRRLRRPSDGLPVPLQYQLIEPELCPHDQNSFVAGGRVVRAGIEFDPIGKRRAYWMYRSHPGDFFMGQFRDLELVAVPAESVIHHYAPLRPGQIRGVPAIVQALIKAKDFDEYDDAELVRKKNRSAFTGAITRPTYTPDVDDLYDPLTGEPINKDFNGIPVTDIQAGQFFTTLPGEDIKLFDGDSTGGGYADFVRQQLLGIGAGQDVPYEFISGDFSELNDRTLRVVLAEYHRSVEQDRWQLTIPQVCYPIWKDFVDMAILSGALPEPLGIPPEDYQKVACHPEGWPYLHAMQDAEADVIRIKNGLTSRKRTAAELGEDIREIDEENAEDKARAESLGLKYGDDAKPTTTGQNNQQQDDQNQQQDDQNAGAGY